MTDAGLDEQVRSLARFPDENPNPVMRIDRDGIVVYANEPSAIVLDDWGTEVGGPCSADMKVRVDRAIATGEVQHFDLECGDVVFGIGLVPLEGVPYLNLYFREITEQRRAEVEVGRLAKFPDENPNPVLRLGMDGVVQYANQPAAAILSKWECERGETVPVDVRQELDTAFATDALRHIEVLCANEQIYAMEIAPVIDSGYANIYARNVTAKKRAERALIEARDRALEANRAKSAFLANMSHELRTPLNAILGYSEILMEDAEDAGAGELIVDLEKINSAGRHLLNLINDILDLSKIEAGRMTLYYEDIHLDELFTVVRNTVEPLAKAQSNRFVFETNDAPEEFRCDATKLRQVLLNLLSNAFKFTNEGTVKLSVGVEETDFEAMVVFEVSDTGIGMTADQSAEVFDAFRQADESTTREYGGTGLGLTITRRFVEMLDGEIFCRSAPGVGSTFTVRLPVKPKSEQPTGLAEMSSTAELGEESSNRGVLVIDDDPVVRDILNSTFRKAGFSVSTATTGEEGIRMARELDPIAITLDVMMPGMDGWTVLSELKSTPETQNIPVVMVTIVDDRSLGFSLGAAEFMTKPVDRNRLIDVVRKFAAAESCRVLVVEDDEATRTMYRKTFKRQGWQVFEAQDGAAGVEMLTTAAADVIVLDLMMPRMNGFEFLEALRASEFATTPVVVVTARELAPDERDFLHTNVERVLQKSATARDSLLDHLCQVVSKASRAARKN